MLVLYTLSHFALIFSFKNGGLVDGYIQFFPRNVLPNAILFCKYKIAILKKFLDLFLRILFLESVLEKGPC